VASLIIWQEKMYVGIFTLATQQDISMLQKDISMVQQDVIILQQTIKTVDIDLRREMNMLETRLESSTKIKLAELKAEMTKTMVGISMAQAAIVVSLIVAFIKFI
jgi:hypothetical protein